MTTIDLHLPTSWNGCTTADLEAIAAAIIQEQQRTDRYHPFDWSRVKLAVVLAINAITVVADTGRNAAGRVVASSAGDIGASGDEWLVQRPEDKSPWPITTGQLVALTERLAFLDDPKANRTIFAFPYPRLRLVHGSWVTVNDSDDAQPTSNGQRSMFNGQRSMFNVQRSMVNVVGPAPLLDGYTWQEYRYLTDWMQEYMRCTNARQDATEPMAQFLAVLFKPAPDAQPTFNVQCSMFNDFSPVKWQVILFWWSSLMGLLQQKFPRVFKPQPVGRDRQQKKNETPWDFYNRVTATIQKYIGGLSEHDVNAATYGTILQQLDMMAQEAQEMEKLKNKK